MTSKRFVVSLSLSYAVVLLVSSTVLATTIYVPTDQPTIQAGIDAAVNGDTVLVANGIYKGEGNRNISFGGKRIVVRSANGPNATIIDCEGAGRGFNFDNGEDSLSVLEGFTIRRGLASSWGGAIICLNASPTIIECVFIYNRVIGFIVAWGGAVYCQDASPALIDCLFIGNSVSGHLGVGSGGGIACERSSPTVLNCIFMSNTADADGSAIFLANSSPSIKNCTFSNNEHGAVIACGTLSAPIIESCIIAFSGGGPSFVCEDSLSKPIVSCSNIYGNNGGDWVDCVVSQLDVKGNISADPLFCDTAVGWFALDSLSPSAPQNNSCGTLMGAVDVVTDCGLFVCGDADGNGEVTERDLWYLWGFYFYSGLPPRPLGAGDSNCDGLIDISDIVYLADYLNGIGEQPCCFEGGNPPGFDPKHRLSGRSQNGD